MERILKIWFSFSFLALFVSLGWIVGRYVVPWEYALVAIGIFGLIFLIVKRMMGRPLSWKGRVLLASKYGAFLSTLLFGAMVAQTNFLRINEWVQNSVYFLRGTLDPVVFMADSPKEMRKMPLSVTQRASLLNTLSNVRVHRHEPFGKSLVSFVGKGLAILEGKKIIPLYSGNIYLLASSPEEKAIFFDNRKGPQMLTKAVVRNNELYKVWQRFVPNMYLHHWGDVSGENFFNPGRSFTNLPNDISRTIGHKFAECPAQISRSDFVRVFDAETGEPQKSIEILPLIAALGEEGADIRQRFLVCQDPLHLNAIHIVEDEEQARYFPKGKVGDILVSLRNVNTLALLDRDTSEIKWHVTGAFKRQHGPFITDRGTVLVFDNKGSNQKHGTSRVVEISIPSRKVVGMYEGSEGEFFESTVRGKVRLLPDDRILVQEETPWDSRSHPATMFVLDCPGRYVSSSCEKTLVFSGTPLYENAAIFESELAMAGKNTKKPQKERELQARLVNNTGGKDKDDGTF